MREDKNVELEPKWNEEIKEKKGFLQQHFEGFDPTKIDAESLTMTQDLMRKRLKVKDGGDSW